MRVRVSPASEYRQGRPPTVLTVPRTRVVLGRRAQIRLPHVDGHENVFLSREAFVVGIDAGGRAYVENRSRVHELIVRRWGSGAFGDEPIARRGGGSLPMILGGGAHWIRNGRTWDPDEGRYGPARGDDRSSWALIEVGYEGDPADDEPADSASPAEATFVRSEPAPEWDLQDSQLRAVLIYFSQFLSCPPTVSPRVATDALAERQAPPSLEWSRLDHLLASATRRGFTGSRPELLGWLVAEGHVRPASVLRLALAYGTLPLLTPRYRYRPPDGA